MDFIILIILYFTWHNSKTYRRSKFFLIEKTNRFKREMKFSKGESNFYTTLLRSMWLQNYIWRCASRYNPHNQGWYRIPLSLVERSSYHTATHVAPARNGDSRENRRAVCLQWFVRPRPNRTLDSLRFIIRHRAPDFLSFLPLLAIYFTVSLIRLLTIPWDKQTIKFRNRELKWQFEWIFDKRLFRSKKFWLKIQNNLFMQIIDHDCKSDSIAFDAEYRVKKVPFLRVHV